MNSRDQRRAEYAAYIVAVLRRQGRLIRKDLHAQFSLSEPAIAAIFTRFRSDHPDAMVYDLSAKGYVPGPRLAEHFPEQQKEEV